MISCFTRDLIVKGVRGLLNMLICFLFMIFKGVVGMNAVYFCFNLTIIMKSLIAFIELHII
jgi:hypothetical protein